MLSDHWLMKYCYDAKCQIIVIKTFQLTIYYAHKVHDSSPPNISLGKIEDQSAETCYGDLDLEEMNIN